MTIPSDVSEYIAKHEYVRFHSIHTDVLEPAAAEKTIELFKAAVKFVNKIAWRNPAVVVYLANCYNRECDRLPIR